MRACAHASEVEELVHATLPPHRAQRAREHVRICASCTAELERLTQERQLFTLRAASSRDVPPTFQQVLSRLSSPATPQQSPWHFAIVAVPTGFAALAAAAVVLFAIRTPLIDVASDHVPPSSDLEPSTIASSVESFPATAQRSDCTNEKPVCSQSRVALFSDDSELCVAPVTLASTEPSVCLRATRLASYTTATLEDPSSDTCSVETERNP